MSDNDLIKRGDVKAFKQLFDDCSDDYPYGHLVFAVTIKDIDCVPAAPREMTAREPLLTENRMIIQDDYAFGDYSALVWQMKIDEAVAFAQNWAREESDDE